LGTAPPAPVERDFTETAQRLLELATVLDHPSLTSARLRDAAKGRAINGKGKVRGLMDKAASDHAKALNLSSFSVEIIEKLILKLKELQVFVEHKAFQRGKFRACVLQLKLGSRAAQLRSGALRVKLNVPQPAGGAPGEDAHGFNRSSSSGATVRAGSAPAHAPVPKRRKTTASFQAPGVPQGIGAADDEDLVRVGGAMISRLQQPMRGDRVQLPTASLGVWAAARARTGHRPSLLQPQVCLQHLRPGISRLACFKLQLVSNKTLPNAGHRLRLSRSQIGVVCLP